MSPLLLAARHKEGTGVLTVLAERGATLDLRTDKQLTALMYAASNGRRDNVQVLLDRGADIDAQSAYGKTALHYAASSGDREMATPPPPQKNCMMVNVWNFDIFLCFFFVVL